MIPILYPANEQNFENNGIGRLSDAVSCAVSEERNGPFELEMEYPVDGEHYSDIALSCLILADPAPDRAAQLFRVYKITKPLNGIVTVYAEHVSYQLSHIPVSPFSASGVAAALTGLKSNAAEECPFEFWTDKTTQANFEVTEPASIRSRLGGNDGSILDVYGGEYEFDNYLVRLLAARGADRGVTLRYGKNITDLKQEEYISNTITGIYPFWKSEEVLVTLPEKTISASNVDNFPYPRTKVLDMTTYFESAPTVEELRTAAKKYVEENALGVPDVSVTVSFVDLSQTEEYKDIAPLEEVGLCDTVTVEYETLGVSAKAKVVSVVYNVLLDKYDKIELGSIRPSLEKTIAQQQKDLGEKVSGSMLESAIKSATDLLSGVTGGYVILHRDGNGQPFEILVMDTNDIATAKNVWRYNQAGWGHSSHGYEGPYTMAATLDGGFVADFITTGTLMANLIKAGILQSADAGDTFFLDLDNGILRGKFDSLEISGQTVKEIADASAEAAKDEVINQLNDYSAAVTKDIEDLQSQIDGNITTWFYDYAPAADNLPASEWTTDEVKNRHLGDLFYIVDNEESGGQVYRWTLKDGAYCWVIVEDTEVTKALANAAQAQDTADSKRRVFVSQPVPPYDTGDLWTQGSAGGLMRCKASRQSGSYLAADWEPATNYIDQAAANNAAQEAVEGQTQKYIFDKLTNGGETQGLFLKDGKVYINVEYLLGGTVEAEIIAKNLIMQGGKINITTDSEKADIINLLYGSIRHYIAAGEDTVENGSGQRTSQQGHAFFYSEKDSDGIYQVVSSLAKNLYLASGNASIGGTTSAKGGLIVGGGTQLIKAFEAGTCNLNSSEKKWVSFKTAMPSGVTPFVFLSSQTAADGICNGKVSGADNTGFYGTIGGDGWSSGVLFYYVAFGL